MQKLRAVIFFYHSIVTVEIQYQFNSFCTRYVISRMKYSPSLVLAAVISSCVQVHTELQM